MIPLVRVAYREPENQPKGDSILQNQQKAQSDRFKQAAREAGADMSKEEFARVISGLAKPQTPPQEADSDEEKAVDE